MRQAKIMLYCPIELKKKIKELKKISKTGESMNSILLKCIEYGLENLYENKARR